jgi:adenylate kinase family enzyme
VRRVNVRGTSGSGKTTTSRRLAELLAVPHIELDALHHGPNWAEPTAEEFRERVETAIAAAPDGWVIDGSYGSKLGDLVPERADTIVWLDLPLRVCLRRLWRRTWGRIIRREELWNGNRESVRTAFLIRDSLFAYTIRRHRPGRRVLIEQIARHPGLKVVRLGSAREVEAFLQTAVDGDVERALR